MQETNIASLLDRADAAKELLHAGGNSAIADFMTELTDAMRATWPIARVSVIEGKVEKCELYAPGLPAGVFELYLAPEIAGTGELSEDAGATLQKKNDCSGIPGVWPAMEGAYLMGRADAAPSANDHFSKLHAARFDDASANLVGLLLWALFHHQGASSTVGQPIRRALKIGEHERLTPEQVATARATVRAFGFDPER